MWDQFDLENGVWKKPTRVFGKSQSRRLMLNSLAQRHLKHMQQKNPGSKFLFAGNSYSRTLGNLEKSWAQATATAEIPDVELQNLRPTFSKHLFGGLPELVVHRLLDLPEDTE